MAEKITIFAYGSLINQRSLTKTSPNVGNIFPAKVYGVQRSFCLASSHRTDEHSKRAVCVLNLEPGVNGDCVNGICFELDKQELAPLLHRERDYEFRPVKAHHYFEDGVVRDSYAFMAVEYEPYLYLAGSEAQNHYMHLCLSGCGVYGQTFVDEFMLSTRFWGIKNDDHLDAIWNLRY